MITLALFTTFSIWTYQCSKCTRSLSWNCIFFYLMLLSKSSLKPTPPSSQDALSGYWFLRNDISSKSMVELPSIYGLISLLEWSISRLDYYSPSCQIDYFSPLETKLENLHPSQSDAVTLGDFNTLRNDVIQKLRSLVSSLSIHILPLNATHHTPHSIPSLVDLPTSHPMIWFSFRTKLYLLNLSLKYILLRALKIFMRLIWEQLSKTQNGLLYTIVATLIPKLKNSIKLCDISTINMRH